jgi:hypothetical protein
MHNGEKLRKEAGTQARGEATGPAPEIPGRK